MTDFDSPLFIALHGGQSMIVRIVIHFIVISIFLYRAETSVEYRTCVGHAGGDKTPLQ